MLGKPQWQIAIVMENIDYCHKYLSVLYAFENEHPPDLFFANFKALKSAAEVEVEHSQSNWLFQTRLLSCVYIISSSKYKKRAPDTTLCHTTCLNMFHS